MVKDELYAKVGRIVVDWLDVDNDTIGMCKVVIGALGSPGLGGLAALFKAVAATLEAHADSDLPA